jgi:hypothetical protein
MNQLRKTKTLSRATIYPVSCRPRFDGEKQTHLLTRDAYHFIELGNKLSPVAFGPVPVNDCYRKANTIKTGYLDADPNSTRSWTAEVHDARQENLNKYGSGYWKTDWEIGQMHLEQLEVSKRSLDIFQGG